MVDTRGMPAQDMWNEFAKNMSTKIQEEKRKDVDNANQNVGLVDQHLQLLAKHETTLKSAKESMNPANIRSAAMALDNVRVRLMVTRDWLHRGVAQAPENAAELQAAEERANEPIERIAIEVSHAREQADRLAAVEGGPLTELPRGAVPGSPEETRKAAARVAPLGLCDDLEMQSPSSTACPLSSAQRTATRRVVNDAIAAIADNWRDAARDTSLRLQLEPLFQKSGINPLVDMLVSVATGWLTAQVGALFLKSVNQARNVLTRRADPDLTAMTGLQGPFGGAPDLDKTNGAAVSGIGSNLAKKALAMFPTTEPTNNTEALFDGIRLSAAEWGKQATLETQQLPDPVLVGLAEGLSHSKFDIGYFRSRIEKLVERFQRVETIGQVTMRNTQPLRPIWVVSPTGGLRMALARRETATVDVATHPGSSREQGDEERDGPTGRFVFDSWVDRSLYSLALSHDASPPTLHAYDLRWKHAPTEAFDPGDVRMLGPDRKETTQ